MSIFTESKGSKQVQDLVIDCESFSLLRNFFFSPVELQPPKTICVTFRGENPLQLLFVFREKVGQSANFKNRLWTFPQLFSVAELFS